MSWTVTLPPWVTYVGGSVAIGLLLWFVGRSIAGDTATVRRAARAYGVVLGSSGLARVARVRRTEAGVVAVALPCLLLLTTVVAPAAAGATFVLGQVGALGAVVALAFRASRETNDGERVTFGRPSPLRDVCHPAIPIALAAHAAAVIAAAVWASSPERVGLSLAAMAAIAVGTITLNGAAFLAARWMWRRPWRARHTDDLAAMVVLRADAALRLVSLPLLAHVLLVAGALARLGGEAAIVAALALPLVAAALPATRHAKGLAGRLGLAWPPPEAGASTGAAVVP